MAPARPGQSGPAGLSSFGCLTREALGQQSTGSRKDSSQRRGQGKTPFSQEPLGVYQEAVGKDQLVLVKGSVELF